MLNNNKNLEFKFRRFEFKYRLPLYLVNNIITDLMDHMKWDSFVVDKPGHSYQVNSLYFDSSGLSCYHEKIAGVKKRKKLRLRSYGQDLNPENKFFLEIKRKEDMTIVKDRLIIDYQDHFNFIKNNSPVYLNRALSPEEKKVLEEFLWTEKYNCLTPKIMVIYKRRPLVSHVDKRFRITFDSDIKAYPADHFYLKKNGVDILSDQVVMELKYNNNIPGWFHDLIKKYQLIREPFSKYCLSLEGCYRNYKYV